MNLRKYIGDKAFYSKLLSVMIPILVQNVITNFVSLLDNIMVGRVGTEPMSGVAIVNQLLFVFNICIFGGLAGPGIFTAQYFGKGDETGVRRTFRIKLVYAITAIAVAELVLSFFGGAFIRTFLHEGEAGLDLEATFGHAMDYKKVMLLQIPLFAMNQVYVTTLRETGETRVPMLAGIAAVLVNLVFNYILIFGKLGAPALGVVGAAIATVISRVAELAIVVTWTHRHTAEKPFVKGMYGKLVVPRSLIKEVTLMGLPLMANEALWALGMTMLNQSYSTRGLEVVSATNISSTVSNLFFCAFFATGSTVAIIVGQLLGAGETERAVDENRKMLVFSTLLCAAVGAVMFVVAPLIPRIYNTTDTVRGLASSLIRVAAVMMPFYNINNASYFALRAGGKTKVTFLYDCGALWVFSVSIAFILSRFTKMPVLAMYICVQMVDLLKVIAAILLIKSRIWVNNLVNDK